MQRKMASCAKPQTLFVQISLSDVDSVPARKILSMQMAVLSLSWYTQPLNNRISSFTIFFNFFIIPLSVKPIRILPVNKTNFEMLNVIN